ncbi:alpha/beta hydrolase [Sphingomonas sp. LB-2]|uniref:alpha/beta hydrolase n=1 Tax=Sphingomonas caeni TaxID=2984949 RepID=UPI002231C656|nr:alpha/beta hydrolase [Sphingomonas caeni]MCW3846759.1 alpha/beta hydrolase [Sphingomonas caeni]
MKLWIAALLLAFAAPGGPQRIPLWSNGAPGSEAHRGEKEVAQDYWVNNIHDPSVTVFRPEHPNGTAVVIAPGGGHRLLVINAEGNDTAKYFNSLGVTAFVLRYRLARQDGSTYTIEGTARGDTLRAMRLVRARAKEFGIDPDKIGLMGFSAGGELVSMVADGDPALLAGNPAAADPIERVSARPDFQILVYPGPLGIPAMVPKTAPQAFLVAASDDECCSAPVLDLVSRLRLAGIPNEVHLFARGGHAFNMGVGRTERPGLKYWPNRLTDWLEDSGLIGKQPH